MDNKHVYVDRRNNLINTLDDGLVIIPTTQEIIRNQDSVYQYRFDSSFYYLTGFDEPDAVLVLDIKNKKSILFCREKNPEREIWDGFRHGVLGAKSAFKFDESYSIVEFSQKIVSLMENMPSLYYTLGHMPKYDGMIIEALSNVRNMIRRGVSSPHNIIDINRIVAEMRLFKDAHDIELISKTCEISGFAHIEAMKFIKNAKYEYEVEAKILEVFYKHGARYPSYTPIVASGANSCVLHYVANNSEIRSGDLLLVDAGCEYKGFAGDITRTYPVNGKFTKPQQAIYEIVLEANKKAIEKIKVGVAWNEPGDCATQILIRGLIDLGLLKGSVEDNIANNNYKQFYMHGIGHWLGLDVHDVGVYKINGKWRNFKTGMCTTIEPGLYIRPDNKIPEEYWNIGIRIEDDILLSSSGIVNMTSHVPKEVKDIETLICQV
jgi:Xaa-Pro aminopeptidase